MYSRLVVASKRETDRQTDRQTDRDRETDRETERDRESETETVQLPADRSFSVAYSVLPKQVQHETEEREREREQLGYPQYRQCFLCSLRRFAQTGAARDGILSRACVRTVFSLSADADRRYVSS